MDANIQEWVHLFFRWIHVVAGVMWIGHLYFFNFVNGPLAATYDADSKKKVIPELMPRALFWFRWGAAYTWITGVLLLGMVYYMSDTVMRGGNAGDPGTPGAYLGLGASTGIGLALLVVGFAIYDVLWKSGLAKNEKAGAAVSYVLVVAVSFGLYQLFGGRAAFMHLGALFGTIMAANVWMRIWPAQKKLIAAAKEGTPADPAVAAMGKIRSKHNTYMSVPLILTMVSNHFPLAYGNEFGWLFLAGFVGIGWLGTMRLYKISTSDGPKKF